MGDSIVYDKAKYHYGGDYPEDLSDDQAFVHTGMFLGWLIDNDLYSDFFQEESEEMIIAFKNREMTGAQIYEYWDGALIDDMLNEEGNAFAHGYFDFETGQYLHDYEEILTQNLPSIYHVEDTWENYLRLKERVDEQFKEWKKKRANN